MSDTLDGVPSPEIEAVLGRIPSVTAARVVTGAGGRVTEVHLLANRDRSPKQLVRDVQSVALAHFGVEIDYRTVSVVQLEDRQTEGAPQREPSARVALVKVSTEISGHATEIRVHLDLDGRELIGASRGPAAAWVRLVSRAVVDAVSPLLGTAAIEVDFAEIITAGSAQIALTILRTVTDLRDNVVSGSAVVHRDLHDGVARATLAALNRIASTPPG